MLWRGLMLPARSLPAVSSEEVGMEGPQICEQVDSDLNVALDEV